MEISQPEVTAIKPSQASLYLEYLQLSDRVTVREETVPGGGEHMVVSSLSPGHSPQVRAVL